MYLNDFFFHICIRQVSRGHLHEVVLAGPEDTNVNPKILVPPFGAEQPALPSIAGVQVQWSWALKGEQRTLEQVSRPQCPLGLTEGLNKCLLVKSQESCVICRT
jgi:hypothetical protein